MKIRDLIEKTCVKMRIGHANNSSSSHSILIAKGKLPDENAPFGNEYGWDDFMLTSTEEKNDYLDTMLWSNIMQEIKVSIKSLPYKFYENIIKYAHKTAFREFLPNVAISKNAYIDHESVLILPLDVNGLLNFDFFNDLKNFIVNTNQIVIEGGSDNNEKTTYVNGDKLSLPLPYDLNNRFLSFKDQLTNYWILKSLQDGSVFIYDMCLNAESKPIKKTEYPLLIDINITDKCENGCPFCYRDCTEHGSSIDNRKLYNILDEFKKVNIPDIVIGGGDILDVDTWSYTGSKLTTFSTTLNPKSLEKLRNKRHLLYKFSSVAVSINGTEDFENCRKMVELIKSSYPKIDIVLQVIFEHFLTRKELRDEMKNFVDEDIIKKNVNKLSLLGWKQTGRASNLAMLNVNKEMCAKILDEVSEFFDGCIYFDSVMVERYGEVVNCSYKYKVGREGVHSCFYDPINGYLARNSFSEQRIPLYFNGTTFLSDFKEAWKKIN
jgi:hypothetical protein